MNQFHSSSEGQSIKKHRYTMGYKSSQTIAAISWKTLHTIIKKKYILHWRISPSRTNAQQNPFKRWHRQIQPSWGNKSVMPNTINSMKYWLPIKFPCPETWVPLKEKIAVAFLITLIIHGDQILTDNQKMEW